MLTPAPPRLRRGFKVAVICALPLEAENMRSVFDRCWEDEDKQYGKMEGDQNTYTTGVIGKHNVVLAHMPGMGSTSASAVAAGLRSSFPGIELALVVGICGVVPIHPKTQEDIVLGDIVVSTAVIQYDFGRQYPNEFLRKKEIEDSLGRASPEIRSFINMLQVPQNRKRLTRKLAQLLQSESFQTEVPASKYPGEGQDRLYEASYVHQHRPTVSCDKYNYNLELCSQSCDEVGCEEEKLVLRNRHCHPKTKELALHFSDTPLVHFGRYGSANSVMKSGTDRDRLAKSDELVAFEMESAGVWDQHPTVVIKAACDYADSHKNKDWQEYAAAMAAACTKVFLEEWPSLNISEDGISMALTPLNDQWTKEPNASFREAIDGSRRAFDQSVEAIQRSRQQRQSHHVQISNLNDEITNSLSFLFGLAFHALAFSLILAAHNKCVQILLGSRRNIDEMIRETEQCSQALMESQREVEVARMVVISECERVGRAQSELEQGGSAGRDGVGTEVFNDDYSLDLLFGDCHNDAEDLTLYNPNTQIGRGESEATHTPHETILCQTGQSETQSDQRPRLSNHEAMNDQGVEAELLRYQINALRSENKKLKRNLRQLRVEIQENNATWEAENLRTIEIEREHQNLEEEKERRKDSGFSWCTIL